MSKIFLRLAVIALLPTLISQGASPPSIRLSTWYWLNAAAKSEWSTDFKNMQAIGFTDVLLVWGLDAAAFSFRVADSREAIQEAHAAGLRSYIFIWHARHNSLDHKPEFEQVDAGGHHLFAFDTFNPDWRRGPWTAYLQTLARSYGSEPGLAGYVFDNSFAIGQIGGIAGATPKPKESYLSYNAIEKQLWNSAPPHSTQDKEWSAWTAKRKTWWADWARETTAAIRAIDKEQDHEVFMEDGSNAIDADTVSRTGVDFERVAKSFDAVGAYFAPAYSDKAVDVQLEPLVTEYLKRMQTAAGRNKVALSLRLSEGNKEDLRGPATYPTLDQIRRVINAAIGLGVRHVDLYGYRMGVYHLDAEGWQRYRPKRAPTYQLTGEIKGKFLRDRPELWSGLKEYFAQLQAGGTRGGVR